MKQKLRIIDPTVVRFNTFNLTYKSILIGILAASLAIMYKAPSGIRSKSNEIMIEEAMEDGQFERAEYLLENLESEISPRTYQKLEERLDRERLTDQFDMAIENYDIPRAVRYAAQLQSEGLISTRNRIGLEERVETIRETGLFQRILASPSEEALKISARYLELHPEGLYAQEVRASQLANYCALIADRILEQAEIETISRDLTELHSLLTRYQNQGITLKQNVCDEMQDRAAVYLVTQRSATSHSQAQRESLQAVIQETTALLQNYRE